MRSPLAHLLAATAVSTVVSCGAGREPADQITISVASSLTEQFEMFEDLIEEQHAGLDVRLNIAGSATLVNQEQNGAAVDIIALADEIAAAELATAPLRRLALESNHLVVIQPADRAPFTSLDDLADPELRISACDPTVPCGRLTERALAGNDASVLIDSLETNVRIVRERVVSGEVDIGFVYATDAIDLPPGTAIAPIDLSSHENTPVVALLSDRPRARAAFDLIESATR